MKKVEEVYQIFDLQKGEYRSESSDNKEELAEEFRDHWYRVNYDSEYTDIINSVLDETATTEEVEKVMRKRVYGIPAEKYLKQCGFEVREAPKNQ